MRSVFSQAVAVCLLVVILLAPSAFASDSTPDAGLWDEFLVWLQARIDIPGGFTVTDEDLFTVWLMSRLVIPGG